MNNMIVEVIYKNKNLNITNIVQYDFAEYCEMISKRILGVLYKIDNVQNKKISDKDLKKYIFNIAGSIKRLPDNIKV